MTHFAITVQDFMRLQAVALRFDEDAKGLVPITGRNAQGKTSLRKALQAAFGGARMRPGDPIHHGAECARIEAETDRLRIVVEWPKPDQPDKCKLSVFDRETGARYDSPQRTIEALRVHLADPVEFLDLSPLEQARAVLSRVRMDYDLQESYEREQRVESERTERGREVNRLRGAVAELEGKAEGAPAERVEVSDLLIELDRAQGHNAEKGRLDSEADSAVERSSDAVKAFWDAENRISEIEKELAAARQDLEEAGREREAASTASHKANLEVEAFQPIDLQPIQEQIANAETLNAKWQASQDLEDRTHELQEAESERSSLQAQLEVIRAGRISALDNAEFPADRVGYDPDAEVLKLGDVPFSQASDAEQLLAACQLCMPDDAQVRLIWTKRGSDLDAKSASILDQVARDRGYLVLAERVAEEEGESGIWIEDGRASGEFVRETEEVES